MHPAIRQVLSHKHGAAPQLALNPPIFVSVASIIAGNGAASETLTGSTGDLMLMFVTTAVGTASAPDGWTAVPSGSITNSSFTSTAFYRFRDVSDSEGPSVVNSSGTDDLCIQIIAYSGVNVTTPVEAILTAADSDSNASTTFQRPTTLGANRKVVNFFFGDDEGLSSSAAGGYTERTDSGDFGSNGSFNFSIYDQTIVSASQAPGATLTWAGTIPNIVHTIALALIPAS